MKKLLFISNHSKRFNNFSIPSIIAGQRLGYEVHMAANYSNFEDDPKRLGVTLHHLDINRNPFNIINLKAYRQLNILIKKEKFDVVHCNTPIGGILGRISGNKMQVPTVIYSVHGFHFYKGAPFINRVLYKRVEQHLAKYTDAIITINQEDFNSAKKLKLKNSNGVFFVPGVGVDTSKIKEACSKRKELLAELDIPSDSIILISVGELNKNKNNKIIIEALSKIEYKNVHYLLCGEGDKYDELQTLTRKNNVVDQVHFLGHRADIKELLKSSDVFLLPSFREGLSRSLMEAMSAGLPCIVSDIRGNRDLITHERKGGFLSPPNNKESFIHNIKMLVNDEELRTTMGSYNLRAIEDYDTSNVRRKMLEIYNQVLKS